MATFEVRKQFFDRQSVIDAVGRAEARVLSRSGALVRKIAQRSMPYRKKPAAPGAPPSAHKPNAFLRKFLFFSFDPGSRSVVIGPEKLGRSDASKIQEFGGSSAHRNKRRTLRKLGDGGEIRIGGTGTTAKVASNTFLGRRTIVTYAILRTPAQVRRANQINEKLYGPEVIQKPNPAHPFMGPALAKAKPELTPMWKNAVVK